MDRNLDSIISVSPFSNSHILLIFCFYHPHDIQLLACSVTGFTLLFSFEAVYVKYLLVYIMLSLFSGHVKKRLQRSNLSVKCRH